MEVAPSGAASMISIFIQTMKASFLGKSKASLLR